MNKNSKLLKSFVKYAEDICNICREPFLKNKYGEWINHRHKLETPKVEPQEE